LAVGMLVPPDRRADQHLDVGCCGHWLTFLDADDTWRPGKLQAQLEALAAASNVEVLVSPAIWWHEHPDGKPGASDWTQALGPSASADVVLEPPDLVVDFLEDEWRSICDLVIGRHVATAVGGYEPLFRGMYEDQAFHAKVLSHHPAVVTSRSWYRYRQHESACTATSHRAGAHLAARRRYLRWLARHLDDHPAHDPGGRLRSVVEAQRRRIRHPRLSRVVRRVRVRFTPASDEP
ncbi:MAG: hypothetical protein AAFN30_15300, partial [Actinomycetota bacterium]